MWDGNVVRIRREGASVGGGIFQLWFRETPVKEEGKEGGWVGRAVTSTAPLNIWGRPPETPEQKCLLPQSCIGQKRLIGSTITPNYCLGSLGMATAGRISWRHPLESLDSLPSSSRFSLKIRSELQILVAAKSSLRNDNGKRGNENGESRAVATYRLKSLGRAQLWEVFQIQTSPEPTCTAQLCVHWGHEARSLKMAEASLINTAILWDIGLT